METKLLVIDHTTLVARIGYEPPLVFPDCCGAGSGIGEKIIPETIFGIRVSKACHIHDDCFDNGEATWADFHQSNYMFLRNIIAIIVEESHPVFTWFRLVRAASFFYAVDTVGAKVYARLKRRQGSGDMK